MTKHHPEFRLRRCVLMAALVVCLSAFAADASAQTRHHSPIVERNITYCEIDGVELQLDLARPVQEKGPFPAIVFVHGGGWRSGSRQQYTNTNEIVTAARRGFVAITVTYRLTRPADGVPAATWPAQIRDVQSAVRWLRANAARYRVDPERIGALGTSAGAHLALLLATTDKSAEFYGAGPHSDQLSRVQAVVDFFGPTDLTRLHATSGATRGMLEPFLNGSPSTAAHRYVQASPLHYVDRRTPPVLIFHGANDTLVPVEQSRLLAQKLKAAGVPHELRIVDGQAHGFDRDARQEPFKQAYDFFDRILRNQNAGGQSMAKTKQPPSATASSRTRAGSPAGEERQRPSPSQRNREAAMWVLEMGGTVTLTVNGRPSREIKTASELPKSAFTLEKVSLNYIGRLTDEHLSHLEGLSNLKFLNLNTTRIGDAGVEHLADCSNLEILGLYGTRITDSGLKTLTRLKRLKSVILTKTQVTQSGIDILKQAVPGVGIAVP